MNNLTFLIDNYNKSSFFYKLKLLVVISINNYDTKKIFIENLNSTFFDYNDELVSDINCIKNNIEENKNYELLNIENFLDKKMEKINNSFNERILKIVRGRNSDSLCFLNTRYFDKTRKEYLNYNSNCKKLIPKKFWKKLSLLY